MPCLSVKLLTLNSTRELLDNTARWNNLWQRSECSWPTMRAEPLAQWLDTFAADSATQILVVEDNGTWVAALPLYESRLGPLRIGTLPGGDLCSVGDLLLDRAWQEANRCVPLDVIARGIAGLRWPLVRFDAMFPETRRWKSLLLQLEARGLHYLARHRGVTGLIDLCGGWDEYFAARSRNHRRHMRVVRKRAEGEGTLELQLVANPGAAEIEPLLRRGFEVEDRSWKANAGTSTLRTPGAFTYFVQQAKLVSASGHLLLAYLVLNSHTIAFEYGWQSKGVYHSLKVGYDDAFSHLSPGQLLRCLLIERFFATGDVSQIDYLGPLSDATAKWATRTYPVSRLYLATRLVGRLALAAYSLKAGHGSTSPDNLSTAATTPEAVLTRA